jgi:uncharacterized protein (DUF1697 family)
MALVVFLKGVNVGGHKKCRPTVVAKKLAKYGVTNLGAAGTLVVGQPITKARLRTELRCCLPFKTEAMICRANDIFRLVSEEPFTGQPCAPDIVHFVSVLERIPRVLPPLPLNPPIGAEWLVRIVAVRERFAFGLYRRRARTISVFGQIEKCFGASVTTRNWNTFAKLLQLIEAETPQATVTTVATSRSIPLAGDHRE